MLKRSCLVLLALLTLLCSAHAETELLAINVGKGDALLISCGDYVCLIDTGKKDNEEDIRRALEYTEVDALDAVFITHTDKDHTGGLKWLRKSEISIGALYASAYHPETKREKHPSVKTAEKLDLQVNWLKAGDCVPLGDTGAVFYVLAPEYEIPDNEDDNSLVMMLDSPDGRMLLAGDMEFSQEAVLLQSGYDLACDVLKVPNHGDDDACSEALMRACGAKIAVISTSSEEKAGTPSAHVTDGLREIGCEAYCTQQSGIGVRVRMSNGEISAEFLP